MASNSAKECGVCNDEFDEGEKIPRCLPCCHSLCSSCIDEMINRNKKFCPFCRQDFQAISVRDMGVNVGLIDVLRLWRDGEQKESRGPTHSKWRKEFQKENREIAILNLALCNEAEQKLGNDIKINSSLMDKLLLDNQIIQNEILVRLNEIAAQNILIVGYLREQNRELESRVTEVKEKRTVVDKVKRQLEKAKTSKNITSYIEEIESSNTDVQTWGQRFKEVFSKDDDTRNTIEKARKTARDTILVLQEVVTSLTSIVYEEIDIPTGQKITHVTVENLQARSAPVMELFKHGRIVAKKVIKGKRNFAQVSMNEKNQICLHHLREVPLLSTTYILQHRDLLKLEDTSSRLAFLELTNHKKEKLGRMYIRLTPNTKRADQFCLLCTGEAGPTYVGTNILRLPYKGSVDASALFGDYDRKNGKGGKALVSEVWKEEGGSLVRPQLAGTLRGWDPELGENKAAQFFIYTRSKPTQKLNWAFGIVEEGLQVLTSAIENNSTIKNVIVSDSGLVLPI